MTSSLPSWLDGFPESTRQLFADSSHAPFVSPNFGSLRPAEGEFRFLFSRKMNQNENSVPRLVLILEDLGDDLIQVALTHCEEGLATYSDIFLGREETKLDYSIFVATAIVNTADLFQIGPCEGKLTSDAQSLLKSVFNRKPIADDWRRGRRFSSNSFVATLDPRWKFVSEEVQDLQALCEATLSYIEEMQAHIEELQASIEEMQELYSVFTPDQESSLLSGGRSEIEGEIEMEILGARLQILQRA